MRVTDKFVLFWGIECPLSNFSKPKNLIDYNGLKFKTSEQLFMYLKAIKFNDIEIANKILKADSPADAKTLGRLVKNYDDAIWNLARFEEMYKAIKSKLESNSDFKSYLLKPEFNEKEFVEASPYDKIWGVGLSENDSRILNKANWKGQNLLGKVLNKLRDEYRN